MRVRLRIWRQRLRSRLAPCYGCGRLFREKKIAVFGGGRPNRFYCKNACRDGRDGLA